MQDHPNEAGELDIDPVSRKAIVAACVGTAIEYYDLFVYLYFATTIAKLFFPVGNDFVSLLTAVGAFGLSFIAKPVGALVFSNYADRVSRKSALTATLTLMAIGIGMIAFAPTYATIGIAAPLIVILARLIQAFSTGASTRPRPRSSSSVRRRGCAAIIPASTSPPSV